MPWPTNRNIVSISLPPRKRPIKRRFNGREARITPMSVNARDPKTESGARHGRAVRST
jgi:hypothetical protein